MDQKLLMNSEYQTPPFRPSGIARRRISILKEGSPQNWQYPVPDERGPEGHLSPPPPQAAVIAVKPRKIAYYMILRVYTVMHNMETLDMRRLLVTWITLMIMDYPQFTALFIYYRHVVDIF